MSTLRQGQIQVFWILEFRQLRTPCLQKKKKWKRFLLKSYEFSEAYDLTHCWGPLQKGGPCKWGALECKLQDFMANCSEANKWSFSGQRFGIHHITHCLIILNYKGRVAVCHWQRGRCARTGLPLPAPVDRHKDSMLFLKYEFYLAFQFVLWNFHSKAN